MTPKQLAKLIPKKLKIGGHRFRITVLDDWVIHEKKRYWGLFDPRNHVLSVGNVKEMGDCPLLVGTLWHELFHALWYAQALPNKAKEEEVVSSFEQAFLALLIDNPWLLPWTQKGLK